MILGGGPQFEMSGGPWPTRVEDRVNPPSEPPPRNRIAPAKPALGNPQPRSVSLHEIPFVFPPGRGGGCDPPPASPRGRPPAGSSPSPPRGGRGARLASVAR